MPSAFEDLPDLPDDAAEPGTRDYNIIQWCESRLLQGQRFVESSVGYDKIDDALNAIFSNEREAGASYVPTPKPLSKTKTNRVAKTAEDTTADLTDTRVFWNYATRNPKYEQQAKISNDQAEDWYNSRLIDLRIADVVRYYTFGGTGYAHLYYSRRLNDMMVEAEDPRCIFPIEPISYHTVQDALGVIIRKPRTPNWVKAEYGKDVKADVGDPGIFGWFTRLISGASKSKHTGPLSRRGGGTGDSDDAIPATPTVFVNTMYLDDKRVNKSQKTMFMGDWTEEQKLDPKSNGDSSWSYRVPPGKPIYPFKRMIVWGGGAVLSDGPNPYWHAKYPLIKLTLNPWPKSWLGKAPLWDVLPLNTSLNDLLRIIDDHAAQLAQPGATADRNVSKAEFEKYNSRAPGAKIRTNMASGKGIQQIPVPPLDQSLWEHVNWIKEEIKEISGTADVSQMSSLAQIPSDDTIDTIMKAMTPGMRLRSRILEGFMKEFAEMYLYSIAQFDTLPKRIAKFGPGAVTNEDMDYDHGTFIPDNIPDGEPGDVASMTYALGTDNPRPRYDLAKAMFESFTFNFKPGSLLNSAATQDRMEDFLLAKMGYLSVFTLMENLGKMNFAGPNVQVPNDELGRLQLQAQLGIGMIANAQGRKATDQAPPQASAQPNGDVTLQTS